MADSTSTTPDYISITFDGEYRVSTNTPLEKDLEAVLYYKYTIYRIIRPLEYIDDFTVSIKFNPGNIKLFPLYLIPDGGLDGVSFLLLKRDKKNQDKVYETPSFVLKK